MKKVWKNKLKMCGQVLLVILILNSMIDMASAGGTIDITSNPPGAEIYLDGNYHYKTPQTLKDVISGPHGIRLDFPDYDIWYSSITVGDGETNTVSATLKKTAISVSSSPAGANIYIDGNNVGTTPKTFTRVTPGTHSIKLDFVDYDIWISTVDVIEGSTTTVSQTLVQTTIYVTSSPPGADIYMDGKTETHYDQGTNLMYKTTPFTITRVPAGIHSIKLDLKDYDIPIYTLDIVGGTSTTISSNLNKTTIFVSSSPQGANIYLDNNNLNLQTPSTLTRVMPGTHAIKLTLKEYDDWSSTVGVVEGNTASVTANLNTKGTTQITNIPTPQPQKFSTSTPTATGSSTGSIAVSSTPPRAKTYLDNVYKGTTPLTINGVSIGTHYIELSISGYKPWVDSIDVGSGSTLKISPQLVSSGAINTAVTPATTQVIEPTSTPIKSYMDPVAPQTTSPTPVQIVSELEKFTTQIIQAIPADSKMNWNWIGIIFVFLVVANSISYFQKRRIKNAFESQFDRTKAYDFQFDKNIPEEVFVPQDIPREKQDLKDLIVVKSGYEYNCAKLLYKVKLENNSSETIGDIKFTLFVPDVFMLKEKEKSIPMLEPNESKTVTFEIRPTGECGECNVSGKIEYYNYNTKGREMLDMGTKMVSVICPVLKRKEIDLQQWEKITEEFIKAEENIKELSVPAENLFNITSRVIRDNGMFMLQPEITSTPQLFEGFARFYAEGVTGLRYAAYIEVVGGKHKSRLILKAWAEKEEALLGFYHRLMDGIEKRVDVKIFIDDSIVQQYVHIDEYVGRDKIGRDHVGTQMNDSFVKNSTIGAVGKKCPNCGREVEANEESCIECGEKLPNN